jgi:ABC-type glycerol-3-phosphate transport system substrate-binding protein
LTTRTRTLAAIAALGAAGTLVLAGCGSSSDTAATTAADTAAATTSTSGTSTSASKPIPCVGAEEACSAMVPIGGGASNKAISIELTATNMGEPTIEVDPEYEGAYEISDARFTTGGSIYEFTLNAVESIPAGADLEMTFAQKK